MTTERLMYLPPAFQDAADHGRLILRDGSTATIRLSRREDLPAVREFYARLSPQSRRMRFFSESKPGEDVMLSLCDSSDPHRGMTLLVWRHLDGKPRIVASGSYIADGAHSAEFAVAVDDAFHGKGMGGLMLERLSVLAASHGFIHFNAYTHVANTPMLDVFRHSGFQLREQFEDGLIKVDLSLLPGEASAMHAAQRDRLFTKASIRPFFYPRSIALIGASQKPDSVGFRMLKSVLLQPFAGVMYPVNPNTGNVSGIKTYATAEDLPEAVDLAVIMVPRDEVETVVDQCARRGVRALIVVSSGFAEVDAEGRAKQQALVEKVRGYGMRLLGPNCLGVINTDPEVRLNASLSAEVPARGRVALSSQSGAIGMTLLQLARRRNLGVSMFISMGNKADVTGNDLLYFWEDDPSTDVILLYLESFGNPRRFGRIAREVSRRKPIVCVKSGRYRASPEEHAVAGLFDQTGVIRADSLEDMFDIATLLGAQPLPGGERIGIVTNSRGAGVLCADACAAAGLNRAVTEPLVDLTANATPDDYQRALGGVLAAPDRDAVIVIYTPVTPAPPGPVLDAIARALGGQPDAAARKPVVLVMMTESTGATVLRHGERSFPVYPFPERAADTLAAAARYRAWRDAPPGLMPAFADLDPAVLREQLSGQPPATDGAWLDREAAERLLAKAGIRCGSRPAPDAVPVELEVNEDPLFGPVMNISLAGYHRDVLGDIAYRMAPLTDREAEAMVRSIRGFPLLKDHGADLGALQELILRLSQLIEALPEINAVRLAPVQVSPAGGGCLVGNPLIRISATP
ncbi:MAG TPA: CoA-binding protein [Kiritimatiellia bacterium]|nr:CoA-binding protein [Kiritimatiellia bacterium]HMP34467.1 CoA-binding protein [Kiritimatiellia bacterium]